MKTKKIIALVCVLSMITLAVPQNTDGDFNMCSEQRVLADLDENVYRYQELEDGTVEITGYSGEDTVLTIPDEINGKRVTSIGNWAFEACSGLTKITIPKGITNIGWEAFWGCTGLTEITIPEGVTSIGGMAFSETPWLKNKQSDNPMVVVNGILIDGTDCKGSVVIPGDVTSIGARAFFRCSGLTEITIPENLTSIGPEAFSECSGLTEIIIPEGVTEIEGEAFYGCSGLTKITIPEGITNIGYRVFYGCSGLTKITIPRGVTSIEEGAFLRCCGLTEITIPESVTSIGAWAFNQCSDLTGITIPQEVTDIGSWAFSGTPWLKNKQSENPVVVVNGILIDGTKCKGSVVVPEGVTSIGDYAFYECSDLTEITIPEGVTSIGNFAFEDCSSSFRMCGVDGSCAQKYAVDNRIAFELLNNANEPVTTDEATTETPVNDKNCLSLSRLVEGKPGERVKVDLVLSEFEGKCVDTIFLRLLNNTDLTFESISGDLISNYLERDGNINFIFTSGELHEIKDNEVVLSFYFTIPEDAKPGTIYDLKWADTSDYSFSFLNSVNSPESYYCNFVDGSVKVVDEIPEVTTNAAATTTMPVTTTPGLLPETVSGDVNDDGILSASDLLELVQYIINPEKRISLKTSDMNGDGKINLADAVELKILFLG